MFGSLQSYQIFQKFLFCLQLCTILRCWLMRERFCQRTQNHHAQQSDHLDGIRSYHCKSLCRFLLFLDISLGNPVGKAKDERIKQLLSTWATFWWLNPEETYQRCEVSKSLIMIHFFKEKLSDVLPWKFQQKFYTIWRKITQLFKVQCSLVFPQ